MARKPIPLPWFLTSKTIAGTLISAVLGAFLSINGPTPEVRNSGSAVFAAACLSAMGRHAAQKRLNDALSDKEKNE